MDFALTALFARAPQTATTQAMMSAVPENPDRGGAGSGDDLALAIAQLTLGMVLVHRPTAAERDRGQKLLAELSDVFLRQRHNLGELPSVELYFARERARRGDRDEAIPLMRIALGDLIRQGQLLSGGIVGTGFLVETLFDRGAEGDVAEAEAAIERLAAAPADEGLVIREIWLLRLRTLLARALGDAAAYAHFRDRYRDMAKRLASTGISNGPRRCHDITLVHLLVSARLINASRPYTRHVDVRPIFETPRRAESPGLQANR